MNVFDVARTVLAVRRFQEQPVPDDLVHRPAGEGVEESRRNIHSDRGNDRIARVQDMEAVAFLFPRHGGELRITAENPRRVRKPRNRCDHARADIPVRHQVTQPVFDENAVMGLYRVRIKGAEGQYIHNWRPTGLQRPDCDRTSSNRTP